MGQMKENKSSSGMSKLFLTGRGWHHHHLLSETDGFTQTTFDITSVSLPGRHETVHRISSTLYNPDISHSTNNNTDSSTQRHIVFHNCSSIICFERV